jgi:putative membrane-bound dehydrogenase-like protein
VKTSRHVEIVSAAFAMSAVLAACARPNLLADEPDAPALARVAPTEPAEAVKTFRVLHGFRMELLAAEPLVTDPVAMCYDENGAAYVVEMSDYPYTDKSTDKPFVERTTDLPIGRVRLLEDTDADGRFDTSTIFAEGLSWPTGVAPWKGGIYVAATPDVWYLKDTDGDRRADVRRKVFSGFRKFNVQAVINNLKWGLDHRIYGAGASNGGTIREAGRADAKPLQLSRQDFCFDPRVEALELLSGGARFGNTFDDWQNRFVCNIRNPLAHVVLPRRYLARNPLVPVAATMHDAAAAGDTLPVYRASPPEPWRAMRARRWAVESGQNYPRSETVAEGYFTSASGVTIYRGAAYPRAFYGNMFVGEVSGNLIHRQTVAPDGVTFAARRADEKSEFVASTDNWFRPVNFVNAPDGTLHVLDMYRETIEHPWSIPDDIKALVDLESGRDRGRIYRLAPPGFEPPAPPRLGSADGAELVAQLENPNSWWRDTAHRLLFERQDTTVVEPLRALLRTSDVPVARLHALWSLAGLDQLRRDDLLAALADAAPGMREHAVRLAEPRLAAEPALLDRVLELAGDSHPRVRFQVAFTLGEVSDPRAVARLAEIALRDSADPWIRAAVLSSAADCSSELLRRLTADADYRRAQTAATMLHELARMVGSRSRAEEVASLLDSLSALAGDEDREARMAVILGAAEGLKRSGKNLLGLAGDRPTSAGAQLVRRQFDEAAQVAADDAATTERRIRAVELLACGPFATARTVLGPLLNPREPQPVELAALGGLAGFRDPQVAPLLLEAYRSVTPAVRGEVVQALLARADGTIALLEAIESGAASAADVPAARKTLLAGHANPAIRDKAQKLFGGETATARSDAIAAYRDVLSSAGDPMRGQTVAKRECLICHRLGESGQDVGPNLLTVRHRSAEELLTHILDPNREVAPNFIEYVVSRTDGRVATGIVAAETATSITLVRAEGQTETILRGDIEAIGGTGRSLMPEGLEKRISKVEMADLLALLKGAK